MGQVEPAEFRPVEPEPPQAPEPLPQVPTQPATPGIPIRQAFEEYRHARQLSHRTRSEHETTLRRLIEWWALRSDRPLTVQDVGERVAIKDWLDWVFAQAEANCDSNPGRTHNKRRDHLRAVLNFLVEEGRIEPVEKFPSERHQKHAAGLYYLTEHELDALYWATYRMRQPCRWSLPLPVGAYWRTALCVWYTYGMDTQTLMPYSRHAAPLTWRNVHTAVNIPDRSSKLESEHGWLNWRRKKTKRQFVVPMTREVRLHLESIRPAEVNPEVHVFAGSGGSRPCCRFQELVELSGIAPKRDLETGAESEWTIKDLRKTCATAHESNAAGSASVILGHSTPGGRDQAKITYDHYANRGPLAFRAITTLPYPRAFTSIWDKSVHPPEATDNDAANSI